MYLSYFRILSVLLVFFIFLDDEVCALNFGWVFKTELYLTNEYQSVLSWELIIYSLKKNPFGFFTFFMRSWLLMLFFRCDLFIRLENEHAKTLRTCFEQSQFSRLYHNHISFLFRNINRSFAYYPIANCPKIPLKHFQNFIIIRLLSCFSHDKSINLMLLQMEIQMQNTLWKYAYAKSLCWSLCFGFYVSMIFLCFIN